MPRYHFIVNPAASGGSCLPRFRALEAELNRRGAAYTVSVTAGPGHATRLGLDALDLGYSHIVAAGGDGTVREVAQALAGAPAALGILPLGTGNDLAKALAIPPEPGAALALLLETPPVAIDACTANGRVYLNLAGLGLDVAVLQASEPFKGRLKGLAAYLPGVARALIGLFFHKARYLHQVHVALPGEEFDALILLAAAGNGTHLGGGMCVTPLAKVQDGLLDLCIIGQVRRRDMPGLLVKFIRGRHVGLPVCTYRQAPWATITAVRPLAVELDGEIIEQTPVTFRVLPGALQVVAGPALSLSPEE